MIKNFFQELSPNKKSSGKSSVFGKDLFTNIVTPQRAISNQRININNSFFSYSNTRLNEEKNNIANTSFKIQQDNIINYINIESENNFFESSSETSKNSISQESNKNNNFISPNFININFFGFTGRSPYANPNLNNILFNEYSKIKMSMNPKTQINNLCKNQKRNDTTLVTQLKDKILEYRCSKCNYITNEYKGLHRHLLLNKHYIFPKKIKKGKKQSFFYESEPENKFNQTFIYSISKLDDNTIICDYCGKKFDSLFRLNYHLNIHKYKCEFCYELFNSNEELMEHINMESLYKFNKINILNTNKDIKSSKKGTNLENVEWEDIISNKMDKWESDEEIKKNDFEQSYAFIEDNDDNYDFNKMVKVNDNKI